MIDLELKQKFLDELRDRPNISVAAKRVGIAKATVYRWRKDDADFKKELQAALTEGREGITDLAEGKLIGAIHKGEKWAILTWLEAHTKRFYKPRGVYAAPKHQRILQTVRLEVLDPKDPKAPIVRLAK